MVDGWRDGRLFACPRASVRAAALPACRSQATARVRREKSSLATPEAQQARGTHNSADSLSLACHGRGSTYPTEHAGRSRKERQELQTQTTSAGQQGLRGLLVGCCCEGRGTRGSWGAATSQPASFHLGRAAAGSGGRHSQESSSNIDSTVARTSCLTAPIKLSLPSSGLAHGLLLSFL